MLAHPMLIERDLIKLSAILSEGMKIGVPLAGPVDEFNAELERAICLSHECRFIDSEPLIEKSNRRNRRFADADGSDGFGFDEGDVAGLAEIIGERRGRHPSRGSAADNDDFFDRLAALRHSGSLGRFSKILRRSYEAKTSGF